MGIFSKLLGGQQAADVDASMLGARAEAAATSLDDHIAALKAAPSYEGLRQVYASTKAHVAVQAALAPGGKPWSRGMWSGAMIAEALIGCARPSTLEVYLGEEISVPGTTERRDRLADIWREGFQMAVLATFDETVDALRGTSIDELRRRSVVGAPEVGFLYAHTLQGIVSRAPDVGARMQATMNLVVQPDVDDLTLRLLGAEMECLYRLVTDDAATFNAALADGIEQHRRYWSRPERRGDPQGLFSLGLSFVAKLATTMNKRITVQSPCLVYQIAP